VDQVMGVVGEAMGLSRLQVEEVLRQCDGDVAATIE
jgi:hypothetical protein